MGSGDIRGESGMTERFPIVPNSDWSVFEGFIRRNTFKAIEFESYYWDGTLWLPKSQIEIIRDVDAAFEVVVFVKPWLMKKRNLLEFTYYTAPEMEKFNERD